jgi:hypothetical protein
VSTVAIIGSWFSGLSADCNTPAPGYEAHAFENTLMQTPIMKPKIKNPVYASQLTVTGFVMQPAISSGKIAAGLFQKN